MNQPIYYCHYCYNHDIDTAAQYLIKGYTEDFCTDHRCIWCFHPLNLKYKTNMYSDEYNIIAHISTDPAFFEAMMKLKEENIIEYQSRMAQFRTQVEEQENAKAAESLALKCPKCGSTNISTGARGVSFFWGFLGADKTVNRCAKCGHTWKPRG